MKGIPEEVLYALMFLVIVLFQYLMKRFGPKAPESPPADEDLSQNPEEEDGVLPVSAVAGVAEASFGRSDLSVVAPTARRFSRASLLGNRRAVQHAVVVATILGPCRAFEPHDVRE